MSGGGGGGNGGAGPGGTAAGSNATDGGQAGGQLPPGHAASGCGDLLARLKRAPEGGRLRLHQASEWRTVSPAPFAFHCKSPLTDVGLATCMDKATAACAPPPGSMAPRHARWFTEERCSCPYNYGGISLKASPMEPWAREAVDHILPLCRLPLTTVRNPGTWPTARAAMPSWGGTLTTRLSLGPQGNPKRSSPCRSAPTAPSASGAGRARIARSTRWNWAPATSSPRRAGFRGSSSTPLAKPETATRTPELASRGDGYAPTNKGAPTRRRRGCPRPPAAAARMGPARPGPSGNGVGGIPRPAGPNEGAPVGWLPDYSPPRTDGTSCNGGPPASRRAPLAAVSGCCRNIPLRRGRARGQADHRGPADGRTAGRRRRLAPPDRLRAPCLRRPRGRCGARALVAVRLLSARRPPPAMAQAAVANFASSATGRGAGPQREARVQIRSLADNDSGEGCIVAPRPQDWPSNARTWCGRVAYVTPSAAQFSLLELHKGLATTVDGALLIRAQAGPCTTWRPSGQLLVLETAARGLPEGNASGRLAPYPEHLPPGMRRVFRPSALEGKIFRMTWRPSGIGAALAAPATPSRAGSGRRAGSSGRSAKTSAPALLAGPSDPWGNYTGLGAILGPPAVERAVVAPRASTFPPPPLHGGPTLAWSPGSSSTDPTALSGRAAVTLLGDGRQLRQGKWDPAGIGAPPTTSPSATPSAASAVGPATPPPAVTAEGSDAAPGPHCAATTRLVESFDKACFAATAPLPATWSPLRHV